jgi:hypothetical protein
MLIERNSLVTDQASKVTGLPETSPSDLAILSRTWARIRRSVGPEENDPSLKLLLAIPPGRRHNE